jgi:cytoskeleton protein RodZ
VPEADAERESGLPVGEYLKSVREARGLQLDQASRVTRISKSYLVAIEQGEFEKLPNAAYIKGFLRLYASYLSLSPDEVVRRYESALPSAARPQPEVRGESSRIDYVEKAKATGPGRWLIPALLLVLVILAALFLAEPEQRQGSLVEPAPQTAQPAPAPAPPAAPAVPVLPQLTSAAPAQAAPPQSEPPPQVAPAAGIVLRMRFNQDSWLSITIDDSISQRYDLKAGDVIEWKGSRLFVIDVGDGGAVEAEFNGRPLKALGEAGQPAHVELKAP